MSVLARPQWFVRSPPRLQGPADLSPLSASSAGSPGLQEEDGAGTGECTGYGGSLIMVQHECEATERAAEGDDEERLCSVVLDPLPSALLQSLSARGHVRMMRPPAAATSWPITPPTPPTPDDEHVRGVVSDLVSAVEDESTCTLSLEELVSLHNEHRQRKKNRKARRESHDADGKRKRRKRSTSSSSGSYCTTPGPGSEVETPATPRVNPIFVWVKQSESTITEVLCEDYDVRNRIRLTKTPNGWRAIPRTERLAVLQPTTHMTESARSPEPSTEVSLDLSPDRGRKEVIQPQKESEEHVSDPVDSEDHVVNPEAEKYHVEHMTDHVVQEDHMADHVGESEHVFKEVSDGQLVAEEAQDLTSLDHEFTPDNSQQLSSDEVQDLVSDVVREFTSDEMTDFVTDEGQNIDTEDIPEFITDEPKDFSTEDLEDLEEESQTGLCIDTLREMDEDGVPEDNDDEAPILSSETLVPNKLDITELNLVPEEVDAKEEIKISLGKEHELYMDSISSIEAKEPPPAHASSVAVKPENCESAADLSACKRRRRLSGILPCRSTLRLPPLLARPLPSPVPRSPAERRSPSPAHHQPPCTLPVTTVVCGSKSPGPAHQHEAERSAFLEGLLSQQPLALDTQVKRPAVSQDPPAKRRKSEDITLRNLLGGAPVQESAPRSRLLELLTTSSTPARKPETKRKQAPTPPTSPPLDALAQLRLVLAEVAVPDPLLVPRSRLAALLASPAAEIPRLVRSPPPTTPDTLAVSLSRLQSLLRRPDSELLAWAAKDWAHPPRPPVSKSSTKNPNHKSPVTKTHVSKPTIKPQVSKTSVSNSCNSNPWWLPSKPAPLPPPPSQPSPDVLAAIHALYGPTMLQPHYFASPYSGVAEMSLWHNALNEASKLPPPPPPPPQPEVVPAKPRIACKSLLDLLAKKPRPEAAPALNLAAGRGHATKHERREHRAPVRDSSCPRLWHPLFGSQKSDTWNWRPVAVHGE